MSWIESHEEIGDHWKIHDLAKRLNCAVSTAVGTVHLLWHYTLRTEWRTGNLSKHSDDAIARACWWTGDASDLLEALRGSKWLDGYQVHDWDKYAKEIIYQRLYNERRKYKRRKKLPPVHTADLQLLEQRKKAATLPYRTIPKDIPPIVPQRGDDQFNQFWKIYPRKVGKGAAEKAWKKLHPLEASFLEKIVGAVAAQSQSDQWRKDNGQFIPHPATWLNQRRWEDEVTAGKKEDLVI